MFRVYLLLGSNKGDKVKTIASACKLISSQLLPSIDQLMHNLKGSIEVENQFNPEVAMSYILPMFVMSDVAVTEPVGFKSEDKFLNMAVSCKTLYKPDEVLKICQQIETELGRDRAEEGPRFDENGKRLYHSRLIDIDILFVEKLHLDYENNKMSGHYTIVNVNEPDLIVPHPKLPERPFAQKLLMEVIKKENIR